MVVSIMPLRWRSTCLKLCAHGLRVRAVALSFSFCFVRLWIQYGSLSGFRRGFLLACVSYHAAAWYVAHAVGRGHGGENLPLRWWSSRLKLHSHGLRE